MIVGKQSHTHKQEQTHNEQVRESIEDDRSRYPSRCLHGHQSLHGYLIGAVARDGELHDMYCYGLLRRDFEQFREENAAYKAMSLEDMIARLDAEPSV